MIQNMKQSLPKHESSRSFTGGNSLHQDSSPIFKGEKNGIESGMTDSSLQLKRIYYMAATNAPWAIDPAFFGVNRFEEWILVDLPTVEERKECIDLELGNGIKYNHIATHEKDNAPSHHKSTNLALNPTIRMDLANLLEGYSMADLLHLISVLRIRWTQNKYNALSWDQIKNVVQKTLPTNSVNDVQNFRRFNVQHNHSKLNN